MGRVRLRERVMNAEARSRFLMLFFLMISFIHHHEVHAQGDALMTCTTVVSTINQGTTFEIYEGNVYEFPHDVNKIDITCAFSETGEIITSSIEVFQRDGVERPAPGVVALDSSDNPLQTRDVPYKSSQNCFSFALQDWERRYEFDVSVDSDSWIVEGFSFRDFVRSIGEEVAVSSSFSEPVTMSLLLPGDMVIFLRNDESGVLQSVVHAGIVQKDKKTGDLVLVGKDGSASEIAGTIFATAQRYLLEENRDTIEVYRFGSQGEVSDLNFTN